MVKNVNQSQAIRPLCLCCFGRGGSSLLWHAIGTSPDVWMMNREWHHSVFENCDLVRRLLRRATRNGFLRRLGSTQRWYDRKLQRYIQARMLADLRQEPEWVHPEALFIGVKLMDHNLWRHEAIHKAFGSSRTVVLTRGPLSQCESLMRSGLTLDQACRWYVDVTRAMAIAQSQPGSVTLRFEDLVQDPATQLSSVLAALGLQDPGVYHLKDKKFGADRKADTNVAKAIYRPIARDDLRAFINPDVNNCAIARLTTDQRATILDQTAAAMELIGYDYAAVATG